MGKIPQKRRFKILRGYRRKVIFLKDTGSPYFDEAYFVLSHEGEGASVDQSDMVLEANRIINESLEDVASRIRRERARKKREFLIPFFLGAIISILLALVSYTVYMIFNLS